MSEYPSFDEPVYTVDAVMLFGDALPDLDDGGPLPVLRDPEPPAIAGPVDDPLVLVEHRRIRVLSNYWHAGWADAIPSTWLRASVFERLTTVADALPQGWGLAVFDAWRPIELQRTLYDAAVADPAIEPGLMAPPSTDPATPPPHVTGGAVDVTLTIDGTPIAPGTGFDHTTVRAHTAHLEREPGVARHIRRALFHSMAAQGFVVFAGEWWHFEYGTRRWAAVTGSRPQYGSATPPHVDRHRSRLRT